MSCLTKSELDILRPMKAAIRADIKELCDLECRERAAAARDTSILRSLSRVRLPDDHEERRAALRTRITARQSEYLEAQAALEAKIATVSDHYVRVALSLHFVDLLEYEDAAAVIGGVKGGAVQQLLARYFSKGEGIDSS